MRAILNGLRLGEHGLPLIGSGDWNDGMNMVGERGKGESVWLGFFLYKVLVEFCEIARLHDDLPFVERCQEEAAQLRRNIEEKGWDGQWYRRAYFDDGTPLGSAGNAECRIDSIAQSWSVLSGAGDAERSRHGNGSCGQASCSTGSWPDPASGPALRQIGSESRLYKGIRPGRKGEWRAIHPCGDLGGDGLRCIGRRQSRLGTAGHDQPGEPCADSAEAVATYKVEPYVVAADVYAVSPHIGRGGWTWYTGSAGWMYRLVLESLLGLRLETDKLRFEPCLPADWEAFKVHYRYRETIYHITVLQTGDGSVAGVTVDGVELPGNAIPLLDDRQEHSVEVRIPVQDKAAKNSAPST